ncbi:hypothetical protein NUW54_g9399 [Trametes sanguinea]|uniref:Uncharacterized protein n=1 Tax=Trametes sanguinea TaxID=158606 RepID=A0ACC1P698_9APHY|nr:hypothetical protein NUW54_g9399 [Trametes sanguinea]
MHPRQVADLPTHVESVQMRVIVTGASGVLGTAVYAAFKSAGHDVLGLAYSHPRDELKQLDLTDAAATERVFSEFKPDWVIHCAAERRPDVAEKDPEGARKVRHLLANATHSASPPYKSCMLLYGWILNERSAQITSSTEPPLRTPPPRLRTPSTSTATTKRDGEWRQDG